jgi:hypothetical protein
MALSEYTLGYLQGTDTTGKYDNDYLLENLNRAYRVIWAKLSNRVQHEFLAAASLTGVNSVFTLPSDYGSLLLFVDDYGEQVFPMQVDNKHNTNSQGNDQYYYRNGNTLVLDKAGITKTYTLYYLKKPRNLTFGQASAGAATSMTLATKASKTVDFYNGQQVENITQDWVDTIDDYATTRVATISETAAASDWYGTVPEIPEAFHELIAPKAIHIIKAEFPLSQEKPSQAEIALWNDEFESALSSYAHTTRDVPMEEIFEDWQDVSDA